MRGLRDAVNPRRAALRDEVIRLGPWAQDVEIARGVSTAEWRSAPEGTYPASVGPIPARRSDDRRFKSMLTGVYPEGLDGRSVLDCACNCGIHLLWAKELGAGPCLGFDARVHWIEQARFLAQHRGPAEDVRFEACDLYELPSLGLEPFDITFFKGILYHLPDPVTGLRIAAEHTRELLVVQTCVVDGPPDALLVNWESADDLISGVHGLAWLPTGPDVLRSMLEWCGFPHTLVTLDRAPYTGERGVEAGVELMLGNARRRIEVIAARSEELLAGYSGSTVHD